MLSKERHQTATGPQASAIEHEQSVIALANSGIVPVSQRDEAAGLLYTARRETALLGSERHSLLDEVDELTKAIQEVRRAKTELENHYSDGSVLAPIGGIVGDNVPSIGQVFLPGDPIAEIISGQSYILAYLPRDYLFPIEIGMEVSISAGRTRAQGEIEEILPVSQSVQAEFRNAFRPEPTRQLARIRITDSVTFPTFANVRINRPLFRPIWMKLQSLL